MESVSSDSHASMKIPRFSSQIKNQLSLFQMQDGSSFSQSSVIISKEMVKHQLTLDEETDLSQPNLKDVSVISYKTDLSHYSEIEEPALNNWNKWLKTHKNQQNKLGSHLKRAPQCLVMNTNFNNLYVNQEKSILSDASNYQFCDRYRGHPHFWKSDNNFKNNGKSLGVYQTIQQKYDRSRLNQSQNHCPVPDEKEYVGIPDAILNEKGIFGKPCLPPPQFKWEISEYVFKKRHHLKEKLGVLQEYKPDTSKLAVIGTPIRNIVEESSTLDEKNKPLEASATSTCMFSPCLLEDTRKPILVTIAGKEIRGTNESWNVYFENCVINKKYVICINIKNTKDSCLRYSWTFDPPHGLNSEWPLKYMKRQSKCFYFDKNNNVILPGCEGKIMVYFQSCNAGVFSEHWKLNLSDKPDTWNSANVDLLAVAVERPDSTETTEEIDSYIESCTRYTIARKAVEEILDRSKPQRQELPYDWKLFEEQIFAFNNPDMFYDNKCVHVLKILHSKIGKGPWNYSVNDLRSELLTKSLNENLSEELEEFTSTIYQLLKPHLTVCLLNEKRKSVFELLSCFVSKIEFESTNLMLIHKLPIRMHPSDESCDIVRKSSKLKAKPSKLSKTSSLLLKRNSLFKNKSNISDSSKGKKSIEDIDLIRETLSYCESALNFKIGESELKTRKQEYLEALYVKTYHHLCKTIDHISAVIDSYDSQRKKNILNALKESAG